MIAELFYSFPVREEIWKANGLEINVFICLLLPIQEMFVGELGRAIQRGSNSRSNVGVTLVLVFKA